jgi:hypothetical protein
MCREFEMKSSLLIAVRAASICQMGMYTNQHMRMLPADETFLWCRDGTLATGCRSRYKYDTAHRQRHNLHGRKSYGNKMYVRGYQETELMDEIVNND